MQCSQDHSVHVLENNLFAVYLGNSSRPFARFQSSCSNQPTPPLKKKKKALIYTNHMGRASEVGKYGNPYLYGKITSLTLLNPPSFSALFSLKTKLFCCCAHVRLLLKTLLYAGQYLFIVSCSNRGNPIRF